MRSDDVILPLRASRDGIWEYEAERIFNHDGADSLAALEGYRIDSAPVRVNGVIRELPVILQERGELTWAYLRATDL